MDPGYRPRGLAFALSALALLALSTACGGDDDASPTSPASGTGSPTSSETATQAADSPGELLKGPAGKYSLLHEDIGSGYLTDIDNTYVLDAATYGAGGAKNLFASTGEAEEKLEGWGYLEGYETILNPEGGFDVALLQGSYGIKLEVHLFEDEAGAKAFYDHYRETLPQVNPYAKPVETTTVGDESITYVLTYGQIRNSNVQYSNHQTTLRRGNLVAVVVTIGAEPFITADVVTGLAQMIDEKATGARDAIAPTPTSNFTPPVFTSRTPPAATPTPGP